jgi:hypothetical protein
MLTTRAPPARRSSGSDSRTRGDDVDLEHVPPLLIGRADAGEHPSGRVVDEAIEPPVTLINERHEPRARVSIGEIESDNFPAPLALERVRILFAR